MKPLLFDPIIEHFVRSLEEQTGKPISELPIEEARQALESVQQDNTVHGLPTTQQDVEITISEQITVTITIVRPRDVQETLPVIMYFHGGGWVLGSFSTHERLVKELCLGTQSAVVFVHYTRAPEARFPIAIEQCYGATLYISRYADKYSLDGSRIVVAGDSAGGNIAAAVAMWAQERGGPKIIFQLLLYPVTNAQLTSRSYHDFEDGPWLTKKSMEWFWNSYAPGAAQKLEGSLSPLVAKLELIKNLPPTFIVTAEYDVLRDEGEAYAHLLLQQGGHAHAYRALGAIHDFLILTPIKKSPVVTGTLEIIINVLRAYLQS